jgi:hypothetical protein
MRPTTYHPDIRRRRTTACLDFAPRFAVTHNVKRTAAIGADALSLGQGMCDGFHRKARQIFLSLALIYLACGHTDMRKEINGLAVVSLSFNADPFGEALFV